MNYFRRDDDAPLRAVIYSRISQDKSGVGLANDRQEHECRRRIDYERWVEVVEPVRDVSVSASNKKTRPGWERVLGMVEAGEVDVVVAYHLDRLTRSMTDLERLIILCEDHNVSVATVTGDMDLTSSTGRMVARILASVARQEVEHKADRQRTQHKQRRAMGQPWRAVKAFGYTHDGDVIEEEAAAIRQAAEDFLAGASLASLARRWTDAGLTNSYNVGKGWTPSGVRLVLANPRTAGYVTHNGDVVGRGEWTPILDERTHVLVKAHLADPGRKAGTSKAGRRPSNLLTGIATCGTCGETLRAGTQRGTPTYTCGGWHVTVPRGLADNLVSAAFAASAPETAGAGPADLAGLLAQLDALDEQLETLGRSFGRRAISIEQLEAASEAIRTEREAVEAVIEEAGEARPLSDEEWTANVVGFAESDDLQGKRALLARHTVVTVHPRGRGKAGLTQEQQVTVQVRGADDTLRTILDTRPGHGPVLTQPSDLVRAGAIERLRA